VTIAKSQILEPPLRNGFLGICYSNYCRIVAVGGQNIYRSVADHNPQAVGDSGKTGCSRGNQVGKRALGRPWSPDDLDPWTYLLREPNL